MDFQVEFVLNVKREHHLQEELIHVKRVLQELIQQIKQEVALNVKQVLIRQLVHQHVKNVIQENGHQKDQEVVVIVMQNVEMKNVFKQQESVQVVQQVTIIMQEHAQNVQLDIIQKEKRILVKNVKQEHIQEQ